MPLDERLASIGLGDHERSRKVDLFARAAAALRDLGGSADTRVHRFWVPGRIEFMGKHTDYAGGRSLLCAIERGICVVASARRDSIVRVRDARSGDTADAVLGPGVAAPAGHWSAYPLTVVRRLALNFSQPLVGADIAFASDLPIAAGVSSSSALVVATYLALAEVNDLESRDEYRTALPTAEALAEYLGAVENGLAYGVLRGDRGVGTFGGSEDHTAILCAKPNALVQYSFCPVTFEREIPLGEEERNLEFVVAASGVVAEKSGEALALYNRVASLARTAFDRWCGATGRPDRSLGAAIGASATRLDAVVRAMRESPRATGEDSSAEMLAERVRQFAIESEELIPAAGDALCGGDFRRLGEVVDQSMQNAAELLHNQIDETMFLAARARDLGAIAASAFGAGFGGSVWALVPHGEGESLAHRLLDDYRRRFPARAASASAFATRASGPAQSVAGD